MSRHSFNSDFEIAVLKGNIAGHRLLAKFGENPLVAATELDVWDGLTVDLVYLLAAEVIQITSTSSEDAYQVGIGGWQILITGLDQDFNEISELVNLNGLTVVETTNSFRRVYFAGVTKAGVNRELTGLVSLVAKTAGTLQARILGSNNTTFMSHYTIPTGHTGIITSLVSSSGEGKEVLLHIKAQNPENPDSVPIILDGGVIFENSMPFSSRIRLPERTDLKITALSSAAGAFVTASYRLLVIENKYIGQENMDVGILDKEIGVL